MTATVIGTASPAPYDGTTFAFGVATLALNDGTVLAAWAGTIQHRSRDLSTVLDEQAIPGFSYALAHTPTGPTLVSDEGHVWAVTTAPLALTARPGYSGRRGWEDAGGWSASAGDATVIAVDYQASVAVLTAAGVGPEINAPVSAITGIFPGDASSVHVSTSNYNPVGRAVYGYSPASDSWTLLATGPIGGEHGYESAAVPVGGEWLWPSIEAEAEAGPGIAQSFVVRDTAGNVLHRHPFPSVNEPARSLSITSGAALPGGSGALVAGFGLPWSQTNARAAAFVITDGEMVALDLPLPEPNLNLSFDGPESLVVSVSPDGSTAVIGMQGNRISGGQSGITLWTVDLGRSGILHVDTLTHPWWLVGTRDPSMHYELLVGTALGWVREIVAGEESLATHELMVSDGMEWHEAALFRPEA